MILSICIPTFNRSSNLHNCLNSIKLNLCDRQDCYEICISDNSEDQKSQDIVSKYKESLPIKYNKNQSNIGRVKNYLKVVDMACGKFVWLIGDDDLLVPNAIKKILELIEKQSSKVDFFYINSFLLNSKYIFSYNDVYDTKNLPKNMKKFSKKNSSEQLNFHDLLSPKISFDFLGGMYLAVFRKKNWDLNINYLDINALNDNLTFSFYDNTFPHVKIFAKAFKNSQAYFYHKPLSVTLSGQREWSEMYPFVRSVRLIESLDVFKQNVLSRIKYHIYKNYALRYFAQDLIKMFLNKKTSGFEYLDFNKHVMKNAIYPNMYLSFLYFFIRKLHIY